MKPSVIEKSEFIASRAIKFFYVHKKQSEKYG
jgi:hypothetical protein